MQRSSPPSDCTVVRVAEEAHGPATGAIYRACAAARARVTGGMRAARRDRARAPNAPTRPRLATVILRYCTALLGVSVNVDLLT